MNKTRDMESLVSKPSKIKLYARQVFRYISILCILFTFITINVWYFQGQKPDKIQLNFTQKWSKIKIQSCAKKYARMYAVPDEIVLAVIQAESGYRLDAVSHAHAIGVMQIMPITFKSLMGAEIKSRGANPFNPEDNINAGVKYLAQLKKQHKRWHAVLSVYNSGHADRRYKETFAYVDKVLLLADYK